MKHFVNKKCEVEVNSPFLVKCHCIKSHDNVMTKLIAPQKASIHNMMNGTYLWEEVSSGQVNIGVPFSSCSICEINLQAGESIAVTLGNLLAVQKKDFPKTRRFYDLFSFIEMRHHYSIVKGEATIYLYGGGALSIESIDSKRVFERNSVIAFTTTLAKEIVPLNTNLIGLINNPSPFKEAYCGKGWVVSQTAPIQPMKGEVGAKNKIIDYVNAIVGMR